MVGNVQLFAQGPDGGKVGGGVKAHIHRDGAKREGNGIKTPQLGKRVKERQRVFSRRNANGNAVAGVYHLVIFQRTARIA